MTVRPPWNEDVPTVDGRSPRPVEAHAVGGVRLAGLDWRPEAETGPPFLLVHGLASRSRLWDGVAASLVGAGHRVVAIDQRGHGLSDHPDEGYDGATLSEDLHAWVTGLGLDRPVLAGQSWGASVVLEATVRDPQRYRAVALVDGGVGALADAFHGWESARDALTPPDLTRLDIAAFERMFRSRTRDWPESGVRGALSVVHVTDDGTVAPHLSRERHLRILRHLYDTRPDELYGRLEVPLLAVLATDGPSAFAGLKEQAVTTLLDRAPAARVHRLQGVHDLHAQQPHTVAGMLRDLAASAP